MWQLVTTCHWQLSELDIQVEERVWIFHLVAEFFKPHIVTAKRKWRWFSLFSLRHAQNVLYPTMFAITASIPQYLSTCYFCCLDPSEDIHIIYENLLPASEIRININTLKTIHSMTVLLCIDDSSAVTVSDLVFFFLFPLFSCFHCIAFLLLYE